MAPLPPSPSPCLSPNASLLTPSSDLPHQLCSLERSSRPGLRIDSRDARASNTCRWAEQRETSSELFDFQSTGKCPPPVLQVWTPNLLVPEKPVSQDRIGTRNRKLTSCH